MSYLGPAHRLVEVCIIDIPSVYYEIIRFDHWQNFVEWHINLLLTIPSDMNSRRLCNRPVVVCFLLTLSASFTLQFYGTSRRVGEVDVRA